MLSPKSIFLTLLLIVSVSARAAAPDYIDDGKGTSSPDLCPNAEVFGTKLITGICWTCMLPFKLFGVGSPDAEPDGSSNSVLCACEDNLGVPKFGYHVAYWNPLKLVEVVRQPYCSPVLGGTAFGFNPTMFGGYGKVFNENGVTIGAGHYHVNYWAFPLMAILELILQNHCQADYYTEMDLIGTTTIDPIANDSEVSLFMVPEVVIFSNPLAQAACSADCSLTTGTGKSSDGFFWCAGCWGSMYPLTTWVDSDNSPPRASSLVAARYIALQHRRGFARKTYGNEAMCGSEIFPFFPKQQYRWSMLYPIPEASSGKAQSPTGEGKIDVPDVDDTKINKTLNGRCCHATGESTFVWGEWRNIPVVGEDFVYMLWSYTDCCAS